MLLIFFQFSIPACAVAVTRERSDASAVGEGPSRFQLVIINKMQRRRNRSRVTAIPVSNPPVNLAVKGARRIFFLQIHTEKLGLLSPHRGPN